MDHIRAPRPFRGTAAAATLLALAAVSEAGLAQEGAATAPAPAQITSDAAAPGPHAARVPPRVPTSESIGTAADGTLAQGAVPPAGPAPARVALPSRRTADLPLAGVAGLLAAAGVSAAGIAAMRRRRPEHRTDEDRQSPHHARR
jgi:hypothetical protein